VVVPLAAVLLLFAVWEAGVRGFGIPEYILPAPSAIYVATMEAQGTMLRHTGSTLITILLGFGISIVISLPLAILVTSSPTVAHAVYPILVLIQSVPKVALAPILVLALGAGEASRVTVAFLVAFFPLVISTATGLLAAPAELIELSRSLRASRFQQLFLVRLPYSVPFIFSGLKLAMTFSVVGAVVGEFVAADQGLGYQIMSATAFFRTSLAFGALLILSFLGIVLFQVVVVAERIFFPWAAQEERS
jgi:NitT/TauT family transport system permease protein